MGLYRHIKYNKTNIPAHWTAQYLYISLTQINHTPGYIPTYQHTHSHLTIKQNKREKNRLESAINLEIYFSVRNQVYFPNVKLLF